MRSKLKHLFIYHPVLDSSLIIRLLVSFEQGDLDFVQQHVTKSNVNNSIGVCGFLPLELAIIYDHKSIFDYLVHELNANLHIKNKSFESMPFVALTFQRQSYLFDLLTLDTSTLYDCTNKSKRTLMHKAAIYNDIKTVQKLINDFGFYRNLNEYELSYLLYDKYNCSPLYYACWFGFTDIVEELLKCYYDIPILKIISFHTRNINHDLETEDSSPSYLKQQEQPNENLITKSIHLKDSSLSISILYNRYECTKLLLNNCLKYSCLLKVDQNNYKISTELDSWYAASMKLYSSHEYYEMRNIFHELILNGAKFSNHLFVLIDSMNSLHHFNQQKHRVPPFHVIDNSQLAFFTKTELVNYTFVYSKLNSNYLKCLAFMCNYNLEKLFDSEEKCAMFLKSCFVKLNEIFLVTNNWHLIDEILIDKTLNEANQAVVDHFIYNQESIRKFLYDLEQFLKALYSNGLAFKFFPKKKCFNFLRKFRFVYHLIETHLYNESSSVPFINFFENNKQPIKQMSANTNLCEPLRLAKLAKLKIKKSLTYLDISLINKLDLPKNLSDDLSAGLVPGLEISYERNKMNKLFKVNTNQNKFYSISPPELFL